MNKNEIKYRYKSFMKFILNKKENKRKENKDNFLIYFLYKKDVAQTRKYLKKNLIKTLFLIEILILTIIKINLISPLTINTKRCIIFQNSLIKLKIENSGRQKIYSNGNYQYCNPVIIPDEIYINGENQNEIKNEYNFENNNNEIILKWYNPLEYTTCMFRDCTSITEIDLSNFDDSKLTQMQFMFRDCQSLKKIEMSNIKGNKVIDTGHLFSGCIHLETINLANFLASNNRHPHYFFNDCKSLTSLNFPNFNTNKSIDILNIFYNCNSLKYINIENSIISNKTISEFNFLNSNHIICAHSAKLISIIKSKSAVLNCENDYCINQIIDDDCSSLNYKYKYRNKYFNDCPEGTKKNNSILENDKIYFCKPICKEKEPFEIIKDQKCVKYCTIKELNNNICILNFKDNNQETLEQDILLKNLENYFISEDYNTTIIEQGEDEIYQEDIFSINLHHQKIKKIIYQNLLQLN